MIRRLLLKKERRARTLGMVLIHCAFIQLKQKRATLSSMGPGTCLFIGFSQVSKSNHKGWMDAWVFHFTDSNKTPFWYIVHERMKRPWGLASFFFFLYFSLRGGGGQWHWPSWGGGLSCAARTHHHIFNLLKSEVIGESRNEKRCCDQAAYILEDNFCRGDSWRRLAVLLPFLRHSPWLEKPKDL